MARSTAQSAQRYLKAARTEAAMADVVDIGNSVMSQIVNAAMAYTDALTAKYAGRANQKDHAAAVKVLRDALCLGQPAARGATDPAAPHPRRKGRGPVRNARQEQRGRRTTARAP